MGENWRTISVTVTLIASCTFGHFHLTTTTLPDELNKFYAWFELLHSNVLEQAVFTLDDLALQVLVADMNNMFKYVKSPKADGILPRVLKSCTNQLSEVFAEIFN